MNAAKPDLTVLLYQGSVDQAVLLAGYKDMPRFDIVLCMGGDEPPSKPERFVGKTQIITLTADEKAQMKKALVSVHKENESRVGKEILAEVYKDTGFKP